MENNRNSKHNRVRGRSFFMGPFYLKLTRTYTAFCRLITVGDTLTAWRENRILEKFYVPVVELPAVSAEYRWPPEQRALTADAAARAHGRPYVSHAEALPIYVPKFRPGLIFRER